MFNLVSSSKCAQPSFLPSKCAEPSLFPSKCAQPSFFPSKCAQPSFVPSALNLVLFLVRGFAKLKKFQKSKQNFDRAQLTHPPPIQFFVLETHQWRGQNTQITMTFNNF